MSDMKDIQGQRDYRRINIKKVGVKNISYPVTVLDKARKTQKTVATVNMYVNLPHQFKGTHMSRFVEILNRFHGEINLKSFHRILEEMKIKLQAEAAHLEMTFPYFLQKSSGQAQAVGMKEYRCTMHGSLEKTDDLVLEIQVPISPPVPSQGGQGHHPLAIQAFHLDRGDHPVGGRGDVPRPLLAHGGTLHGIHPLRGKHYHGPWPHP